MRMRAAPEGRVQLRSVPSALTLAPLTVADRAVAVLAAVPLALGARPWLHLCGAAGPGRLPRMLADGCVCLLRWLLVVALLQLCRRVQKQGTQLVSSEQAARVDGSRFTQVAPGVVLHHVLSPPPARANPAALASAPSRPLLVHCSHGFGANALTWDPLFASLGSALARQAPRMPVWLSAHDRVGFGLTSRPRAIAQYRAEPGARFALALLDALTPACEGRAPRNDAASAWKLASPSASPYADTGDSELDGSKRRSLVKEDVSAPPDGMETDTSARSTDSDSPPASPPSTDSEAELDAADPEKKASKGAAGSQAALAGVGRRPSLGSTRPPRTEGGQLPTSASDRRREAFKRTPTLLVGHSLGGSLSARMATMATGSTRAAAAAAAAAAATGGNDADGGMAREREPGVDNGRSRSSAGDGASNGGWCDGELRDAGQTCDVVGLVLIAPAILATNAMLSSPPAAATTKAAAAAHEPISQGRAAQARAAAPIAAAHRALRCAGRVAGGACAAVLRGVAAAAEVCFVAVLRLAVRAIIHSPSFWQAGVGSAYADRARLTQAMLTRYRWPAQVRGADAGVARFVVAQISAAGQELRARWAGEPWGMPSDADVVTRLREAGLPTLIVRPPPPRARAARVRPSRRAARRSTSRGSRMRATCACVEQRWPWRASGGVRAAALAASAAERLCDRPCA